LHNDLVQLDSLATSQEQRRHFKDAREQLQRAMDTGSVPGLQLGSYFLAVVTMQIREVQDGRRKGAERAARRAARTDRPGGDMGKSD